MSHVGRKPNCYIEVRPGEVVVRQSPEEYRFPTLTAALNDPRVGPQVDTGLAQLKRAVSAVQGDRVQEPTAHAIDTYCQAHAGRFLSPGRPVPSGETTPIATNLTVYTQQLHPQGRQVAAAQVVVDDPQGLVDFYSIHPRQTRLFEPHVHSAALFTKKG